MMPRPRYSVTDAPATGNALRFLVILLLLWIFGRMIANGVFSGPAPDTPLQQMRDRTRIGAAVNMPLTGLASAEPKSGLWRSNLGPVAPVKSNAADRDVHMVGRTFFAASLPANILAGHQLLLWNQRSAAFAGQKPLPANAGGGLLAQDFAPGAGDKRMPKSAARKADNGAKPRASFDRWALDSWAFLRGGGFTPLGQQNIGGQAQYGGSQAGAIARYYPWSKHGAPSLFLRSTRALSGPAQSEIALGALLRPAKAIPVQLAVEQRIALDSGGANKPAAYIVSDIAPRTLPGDVRANIYAQAGIVGISDSAYFFDLQVTLEKPLLQKGHREVAVGAGLWSGGQGSVAGGENAGIATVNRVDIGPHIVARLPVAGQQTQFALDWRQRVAGNADPGSGPALTVSTRF